MSDQNMTFGTRLRELRLEKGMTQDEFASLLGSSKQVLSRYETNQRTPKITLVQQYAEKLNVSVDYLLGDSEDEVLYADFHPKRKKDGYFYKIFIDVTTKMGLDIPGIVRVTGLTDSQVRSIIIRQMKDAPLPLALLLTDTLGVPLEIWTGDVPYTPSELSVEALEIALAYDRANLKDRNTARLALDLESVTTVSTPSGDDINSN